VLTVLGWRRALVLGSGLLGFPALGHLATDRLWAVVALAALRGLGFGIVTVCAANAVAAFAPPGRRGRAGAGRVHDAPGRALVISGLLLAGVANGGLQNLTLTQAFTAAGEPARASVSIVWNLSFDAGTGLGAFATGAIATATSYSAAFTVLALAAGIVGAGWALHRVRLRRCGTGAR